MQPIGFIADSAAVAAEAGLARQPRCGAAGAACRGWFSWFAAAALGLLAAAPAGADLPGYVPLQSLRSDASLRAVCFVGPDRGWAVGDRGAILYTESGGDSWGFQTSGTSDGLLDIAAADTRHLIAVGGRYEPETQISRGVVLITGDGGRTWRSVENDLPRLRSVHIDRDGQIVAVGDFSGMHLTSAFTSRDGGRNWQPIVTAGLGPLVDAAGTPGGPLSYLDRSGLLRHQPASTAPAAAVYGDRRLRAVAGDGALRVAVGEAGTVVISRDQGRSWQDLPAQWRPAGRSTAAPLWETASEAGGVIWVAGTPGHTIWKISPGQPAVALQTPAHTPLHDIFFLDDQRGWAVGAFGVILATRDGGRSWRFQQAGPRRAALLAVAADAASLPWPVLASESLEMGRRIAVVLRPTGPPPADPLAAEPSQAIAQATSQFGGGEVIHCQPDDDLHSDGDAVLAQQALDAFRPVVLLISGRLPDAARRQWTQLAMQQGVGRVLETTDGTISELTLHATAVLPRIGAITGDLWRDAGAIACPGLATPDKLFLRRTYDSILATDGGPVDGLFAGLPVGDPASCRDPADPASRRHLQILAARTNERAMVDRMLADGDGRGSYRARLGLMIDQTPTDNRARLLRSILIRCREMQAADLYRQTLATAADTLRGGPLGRLAALRLTSIDQSQEWGRLQSLSIADLAPAADLPAATATQVRLSPFEPVGRPLSGVQMASAIELTPELRPVRRPAAPSAEAAGEAQIHLAWDFDPRVLMTRTAGLRSLADRDNGADRGNGAAAGAAAAGAEAAAAETDPAASHLRRLLTAPAASAWLRLSGLDRSVVGLPVMRAETEPLLDGKRSEACWRRGAALPSPEGFDLRMAYDAQYIYWSASGPLTEAAGPPASQPGRQRDADLRGDTRIRLQIDIDGDLMSSFAMEVNAQGQTRDTCDGFQQWQPMWFVAIDRVAEETTAAGAGQTAPAGARETAPRWTVEAAVRRRDLQPLPMLAGDSWRVRFEIRRPQQAEQHDRLPIADVWHVATFQ